MLLSFERRPDRPGLEIVDHVESRRCKLTTEDPVEPTERPVEAFEFPVDRGIAITSRSLRLPHSVPAFVRNAMGFVVAEVTTGQTRELPPDRYSIELSAPLKLYLAVESALEVTVTDEAVELSFPDAATIGIGARSYHDQPAGSITTTGEPRDLMAAVAALSSALKSTAVERSYPTLRGHPPTIELGDELDVPEQFEPAPTDVTITVPADRRSMYVIAPLAYYLGADVKLGSSPAIVTDHGFEHALATARGFEAEVGRVLKQAFFLDCLTRTEGYYQVDLHERSQLESDLPLNFGALYGRPIGDQLAAYLQVPFETIEPELPTWSLTAFVAPTPEHAEVLPFLVDDLAVIRSPATRAAGQSSTAPSQAVTSGDFTRSTTRTTGSKEAPSTVEPVASNSLDRAWVADGVPWGASKARIEAFRNRLDRSPAPGDIEITVVCNDAEMNAEQDVVDAVYGSRANLPYAIDDHRDLRVAELRRVLEGDSDLLHYIGHIDEEGFECVDGMLDARTLDRTGIHAFILNACASYRQGEALIDAGSVGGVVTINDVVNSGAVRIGRSLAKLLNVGFPLRTALSIAKGESVVGGQYLVLGDGGVDIAQSRSGLPDLGVLSQEEGPALDYFTYPTSDKGLGSLAFPNIAGNEEYYLAGGPTGRFEPTVEALVDFLSRETVPLKVDGRLHWSDAVDVAELVAED